MFRLITENTIEEKIIERQTIRLKLDTVIIQQGRNQSKSNITSKEELKKLIQFGASEVLKGSAKTIDQDIDALIQKGIMQASQLNKNIDDRIIKEVKLKSDNLYDFNILEINVFIFENETIRRKVKKKEKYI